MKSMHNDTYCIFYFDAKSPKIAAAFYSQSAGRNWSGLDSLSSLSAIRRGKASDTIVSI